MSVADTRRIAAPPHPDHRFAMTRPFPARGERYKRTRAFFHLAPRAGRGRIALAIRVRGSFRKRGRNRFKNARHIPQHIVVPEPQNPVVMIDKPFVANDIPRVIRVLTSVHLNDQPAFTADQIDRVRTDRLLPHELITVEGARPKPVPKSNLCLGGLSSQAPGASGSDFVGSAHVAPPPHPDCFGRCFASPRAIRPLPASGERLAPRKAA